MKGVIVGQFSAEKGMDEAAMESVAESGSGDGLASGAVCFRATHGRLQLGARVLVNLPVLACRPQRN